MVKRVEDFVFNILTTVFNAADTAPLAINAILESGSHDPDPKAGRIEDPSQWRPQRILEKAKEVCGNEGPEGDFDD